MDLDAALRVFQVRAEQRRMAGVVDALAEAQRKARTRGRVRVRVRDRVRAEGSG